MSLKKILRYSSILLTLFSTLILTSFYVYKILTLNNEKKILIENRKISQRYTRIPYIEIPSLDISKIIEKDSSKESLDRYRVAIWNKEKNIEKVNHLILAGHNVKEVFAPLHKINVGTPIYIYNKNQKLMYEVVEKKEISVLETEYLEETPIQFLSLITCTNNNQTRWIVRAKLKKES